MGYSEQKGGENLRNYRQSLNIFIDGGFLEKVFAKLGEPKIDYLRLYSWISRQVMIPRLRTYYYHCLPYQGNPPSQGEKDRFSKKQRFFNKISSLPRSEVRLGSLAFRGRSEEKQPIFEQKKVDVLMALDIARSAFEQRISHIALISSDSDFVPAIQMAKDKGIIVYLLYSHEIKPHHDLVDACDEVIYLTMDDIKEMEL